MARDEAPPFARGETYFAGAPKDPMYADPLHLLGKEYVFEVNSQGLSPTLGTLPYDPSGRAVRVRVVQNKSAVNLKGARVARFQAADPYGTTVDGYAAALADRPAGVIDEFLPPAGVPPGDLFYLVVSGPTLVTQPGTGAVAIAVGDALVPAAGTNPTNDDAGRVAKQDTSGAAAVLGNNLQNRVGVSSAINASVANGKFAAVVRLV
jgi:hypothetical protein